MSNSLVSVFGCLYFWQISKYWVWLEIFGCVVGAIPMVGCYMLPESPKFLISKKKFDEARSAINWIAKFNQQEEEFNK
jgi:hypothetical protein